MNENIIFPSLKHEITTSWWSLDEDVVGPVWSITLLPELGRKLEAFENHTLEYPFSRFLHFQKWVVGIQIAQSVAVGAVSWTNGTERGSDFGTTVGGFDVYSCGDEGFDYAL